MASSQQAYKTLAPTAPGSPAAPTSSTSSARASTSSKPPSASSSARAAPPAPPSSQQQQQQPPVDPLGFFDPHFELPEHGPALVEPGAYDGQSSRLRSRRRASQKEGKGGEDPARTSSRAYRLTRPSLAALAWPWQVNPLECAYRADRLRSHSCPVRLGQTTTPSRRSRFPPSPSPSRPTTPTPPSSPSAAATPAPLHRSPRPHRPFSSRAHQSRPAAAPASRSSPSQSRPRSPRSSLRRPTNPSSLPLLCRPTSTAPPPPPHGRPLPTS